MVEQPARAVATRQSYASVTPKTSRIGQPRHPVEPNPQSSRQSVPSIGCGEEEADPPALLEDGALPVARPEP